MKWKGRHPTVKRLDGDYPGGVRVAAKEMKEYEARLERSATLPKYDITIKPKITDPKKARTKCPSTRTSIPHHGPARGLSPARRLGGAAPDRLGLDRERRGCCQPRTVFLLHRGVRRPADDLADLTNRRIGAQ